MSEATDGAMADFVFVTVGSKQALDGAYELLAPGGALVVVGMPAAGVTSEFDPGMLAAQSQRVLGSKMGSASVGTDIPRLVEWYREGKLYLDELVTERFAFEDINEAIASAREGKAIRNLVVFE